MKRSCQFYWCCGVYVSYTGAYADSGCVGYQNQAVDFCNNCELIQQFISNENSLNRSIVLKIK